MVLAVVVVVVVVVAFLAVLFFVRVVDRLGHWAESLHAIVFRTTYVRTYIISNYCSRTEQELR